jgi:predicted nucleic acid-binding protein
VAIIFLDTNALFKLYVTETGSNWLQNFVAGQQIALSELAFYEVATILRRRYVENYFNQVEALDLFSQIMQESVKYEILPLSDQVQLNRLVDIIFNLPNNLRIRALDAIHLTAAQIALEDSNNLNPPQPVIFVSSDVQLLRSAQVLGFNTENPENHP